MIFRRLAETLWNISCPGLFIIPAKPYIKDEKPLSKCEKRLRNGKKSQQRYKI